VTYDAVYFGKQILILRLKHWLHFTFNSLSTNTVCTTSIRHIDWLIRIRDKVKDLNLIHYIFCT